MSRRYVIADVFTDRAFGGNPLAVYLDAAGLQTAQMQAIAREMNLSETTFVSPGSTEGHFRVRIFTPAVELPFAGHPTVGTAVVLAARGMCEGRTNIVLEENIGPVRVELRTDGATFSLDGAPKVSACAVEPGRIAEALGLTANAAAGVPWIAGYGVPVLFVPLADVAAVSASRMNVAAWHALGFTEIDPYLHAVAEQSDGTARLRCRLFGPSVGVGEDPATGSAAASLAGSIRIAPRDGVLRLSIDQGIEMGRPSRIETETRFAGGTVSGVSVGGGAVIVAEGTLLRDPA